MTKFLIYIEPKSTDAYNKTKEFFWNKEMRLFLTWIYGTFKRTKYPAFYRVVNTAREFRRDFYMRTRFFSLDMTTRNEETKINFIYITCVPFEK